MAKTHVSGGGHQLIASKSEFTRWNDLPYGLWRTTEGREVLFNRFYEPLWQRQDGVISKADPTEWVANITFQGWFYSDGTGPKTRVAQRALEEWRMGATPRLLNSTESGKDLT